MKITHLFVIIFLLSIAYSSDSFQTFKLFSYENNRQTIGSRVGSLNMLTIHYKSQETMARKLALISFQDVSQQTLSNLMANKPGGVLIILPNLEQNDREQTSQWQTILDFYGNKNMIIPIQFTFSNPQIDAHYEYLRQQLNVSSDLEQQEQYRLIVTADQSKAQFGRHNMEDYFAVLDEGNSSRKSETILVLAALDQFMPSQEFVNKHDTSLTVFFSVMQQMQQVFNSFNIIQSNVMFYLTQSSSFGFEGVQEWIDNTENAIYTNSISTILYLDNLGTSKQVYIEQFGNSNKSQANYADVFTSKLEEQNLKVSSTYYLLDQSPLVLRSKKNVNIIRISDKQYNELYYTPVNSVPAAELQQPVISGIVNGLAQIIYTKPDDEIFSKCHFIELEYAANLSQTFSSSPRFVNYLQKDATLNEEARKIFKRFRPQYQRNVYYLRDTRLYSSKVGEAQLMKYQNPFLNVYIFGAVIVYLGIIYFLFAKTPLFLKTTKTE